MPAKAMIRARRTWPTIAVAGLALCVVAGLIASSTAPVARAGHATDSCAETGIWTKSAAARMDIPAVAMMVTAYVGWVPPTAACYQNGGVNPAGYTTQHSALHARRGSECVETVGYRISTGQLLVWGYNCQSTTTYNLHNLGNYNHPLLGLLQLRREGAQNPYIWDHWYYRFDTQQWIFLGHTLRGHQGFYPWLESSGYNASSIRATGFRYFQATWAPSVGGGTGSTNFPCPETEDPDTHQEEDPAYAGQVGSVDFIPSANVNYC